MSSPQLFNLEIAFRAAADVRTKQRPSGPIDIYLCIADHYEPHHGQADDALAKERVEDWIRRYPVVADQHRDWDGRPPVHTFFYPWDQFDAWELDRLVDLCRDGFGEIELHLHHRDDTSDSLRRKFREAADTYAAAGALSRWANGRPAFAFIHGDWALDNSRSDQGRNYCGVNNEIQLLEQEGCYADLTFPSWRMMSQPRTINSIYYAIDDPERPKSHDYGEPAQERRTDCNGLLLIQGPLVPFVEPSRFGVRVAMDDGDLSGSRRYTPDRLDRWLRAGVHVGGRREQIFVKLYCHGAPEKNRDVLLGRDLPALFEDAEDRYNDGDRYRLHYVSAREMYNLVKATEAAETRSETFRDFVLANPYALDRKTVVVSRNGAPKTVPIALPTVFSRPPASRGSGLTVVITVDTEGDDQWSRPRSITVENLTYLPRFQALCDAYAQKPTYLCTYEVVNSPEFADFIRPCQDRGAAEIGAHLHPWTNPPFSGNALDDFDPTAYPAYPSELTLPEYRAKMEALTNLIRERTGRAPTAYRAGRWGFVAEHVPVLLDLGYKVDCSVTPYVTWINHLGVNKGGPDFTVAPVEPYFLDSDDVCRPGNSALLEVPVTILCKNPVASKVTHLRRAFGRYRRFRIGRAMNAAFGLTAVWFRPYPHMTADRLISICRLAESRGLPVVEMLFHSSELMPGCSPYNPDEDAIERLYSTFKSVFDYLAESGATGATLSEFAARYSKSAAHSEPLVTVR